MAKYDTGSSAYLLSTKYAISQLWLDVEPLSGLPNARSMGLMAVLPIQCKLN
jgi:hypothetical protein